MSFICNGIVILGVKYFDFRKPQYPIAHYIGLNLFSCEYEDVVWNMDKNEIICVIETLQKHWTIHATQ